MTQASYAPAGAVGDGVTAAERLTDKLVGMDR